MIALRTSTVLTRPSTHVESLMLGVEISSLGVDSICLKKTLEKIEKHRAIVCRNQVEPFESTITESHQCPVHFNSR
jgi:hypothetical protein